jgi:hypothetical protein
VSDITFFNQFVLRVHDGDRRKSDKPDLIGARISNGIPISCFLVKYQVQAYGLSLKSSNVFLGLTLTKSNICLQVFIPNDGKLLVIDIFTITYGETALNYVRCL